ncbi:hypothetical protein WK62_05200 [Burkholderia ubonensis]|uniref:phage adaptor protein n=1 Tax=Burkholderia ubonensis TaxID=101571 RepID=UPI00075CEBB8|nr:hypothetical protein [Burkholderia ubonensis]KVU10662.1 hypothetical protein WK62_05200 [Burkholderia ubonensis]
MTIFVQAVGSGTPIGVAGIYDYNSLKQAVQDWFARADLGGWIDYFIQMAEADIYRDIFRLNFGRGVRAIEASLNVTIANGVAALPTGYLALKQGVISSGGNTWELERKSTEFIYTQYPDRTPSGIPAYIAREGSNFIFGPFPDSNYTVTGTYWQRPAQLTSVNSVNWLVNTIPTVMLAACLKFAARFNKDEEGLAMWDGIYQSQLEAFVLAERAEETSGSTPAMVSA